MNILSNDSTTRKEIWTTFSDVVGISIIVVPGSGKMVWLWNWTTSLISGNYSEGHSMFTHVDKLLINGCTCAIYYTATNLRAYLRFKLLISIELLKSSFTRLPFGSDFKALLYFNNYHLDNDDVNYLPMLLQITTLLNDNNCYCS